MSKKKSCPGGGKWDNLVSSCIPSPTKPETPSAEPLLPLDVELTALSPEPSQSTSPVSPTVWTLVVLTTVGSILALLLWLIIFIRRRRRTAGCGEQLTKTEVLKQPVAPPTGVSCSESQSSAHSCHRVLVHAESEWTRDFSSCSDPSALSGTGEDAGALTRSPLWGHRIPLPATELGGTALVTTKTV